jgi:uncharacterized protein (DUF58 family)
VKSEIESSGLPASPSSCGISERRVALGSRLWLFLAIGLLATLLPAGSRLAVLLGWDAFVLVLFAIDARRLYTARVSVARTIEPRLRVRTPATYHLQVRNESGFALSLRVRDTAPASCEVTPEEHALRLAAQEDRELELTILPRERGRAELGDLYVRRETSMGMAAVVERAAAGFELRILPESTSEKKAQRKGPRLDAGEVAMRLRRTSQGSELESLREYVPSDPLRAIDWKATAKRRHPVTRLYQPERSQTLWFVLDKSRTMASGLGEAGSSAEKTRFDVALEALLVVADGALRAGDQVGAIVQGDGLELVIPPGRGRGQYRRLLDTLTGVHPQPVRLDVRGLVGELERRARKRCLVVLFTDLENEVHGEALCEHAHLLTRRHLVMCVSLADSITSALADARGEGDHAIYERAAAIDMLRERTELMRRLEKKNVVVLEADEHGLAAATLDRYLEIKTRARL